MEPLQYQLEHGEPGFNQTANATDYPWMPLGYKEMTTVNYIMLTVYLIICVCGLVGNAVAMAVVIYNKNMKTMSNIFIFNLALTDFLFLLSLPFTASMLLTGKWKFGEVMCKIHYILVGINVYAGVYTLVLMSIDRYVAVCYHEWHTLRTVKNSMICCGIVWLGTILLMMPLILYSSYDEAESSCYLDWPIENDFSAPGFAIYTLMLGFMIPVVIISILYTLIISKLRTHTAATRNLAGNEKRTRRVTRLVMVVILAYLFCWTPYWTTQIYILAVLGRDDGEDLTQAALTVYHCTTMLYHVNNVLNPILYGFLSNNFRKGAKAMLTCLKDPTIQATTHAVSRASHLNRQTDDKNGPMMPKENGVQHEGQLLLPGAHADLLNPQTSVTHSMFGSADHMDTTSLRG